MKKILVTGATGFIGNYVIQELLHLGHSVIATSSDKKKAKGFKWFRHVHYIDFNLNQINKSVDYYSFFDEPDAMIHLAWQGLPHYKSQDHLEKYLPLHKLFLENIIHGGLTDLTVAGTCLEYGMNEGKLSEDFIATPIAAYAIAKNDLNSFLQGLQSKYHFYLKWIRLFYMYGKGQSANSLFSQLDMALEKKESVFNMSGGEQVRDYLPIESVSEYITRIAFQNKIKGIINCCSGNPVTIKKMVTDYLAKKNKIIKLNFGYFNYPDYEPMSFWGDDSKLKKILNNE